MAGIRNVEALEYFIFLSFVFLFYECGNEEVKILISNWGLSIYFCKKIPSFHHRLMQFIHLQDKSNKSSFFCLTGKFQIQTLQQT